jgi:hypothetical protein
VVNDRLEGAKQPAKLPVAKIGFDEAKAVVERWLRDKNQFAAPMLTSPFFRKMPSNLNF